ncbi:hypothetical protein D3C72_1555160 [compost metagenome]
MLADSVCCTFAQQARAGQVHPAHAGLGGEVHELGSHGLDVALAQVELLLGQYDDAAAFGRFVGQRCQLGGVGQGGIRDTRGRDELAGLAVAQGNGAGLVQQQHVHVACSLHRAA